VPSCGPARTSRAERSSGTARDLIDVERARILGHHPRFADSCGGFGALVLGAA
jgi:hypothetical protein